MRQAGAALVGLLGTRVELLGVELREEALRLQHMLVLGVVAAFVLGAALVPAGVLVAVIFWETHRVLALAGVTGVYALVGAGALMRLRSSAYGTGPFNATLQELQADLQALRETTSSTES